MALDVDMQGTDEETDTPSEVGEEKDQQLVEQAQTLKDAGNAKLKAGDVQGARDDYSAGIKSLSKCISHDENKNLDVALNLNLSLACIKLEEYFEGCRAASKALSYEPDNLKGLLRRGTCHLHLNNFEEAKTDLNRVLQLDPANADAKRELVLLRTKSQESAKAQKAQFGSLFTKGSLYQDREQEAAKRMAAKRAQWEQEMKAKADNEQMTFEEWYKQNQATESANEQRSKPASPSEDKPTADKPPQTTETAPKKPTSPPKKSSTNDDLELDDEDLKIIEETKRKGYCYFRKELTEEEQRLKELNRPAAISPADVAAASDSASPSTVPANKRGVSDWNARGTTYEEKDTTAWCQKNLKRLISQCTFERKGFDPTDLAEETSKFRDFINSLAKSMGTGRTPTGMYDISVKISGEPSVEGDAQVMVVRGTKRWFFDFTAKFDWEASFTIQSAPEQPAATVSGRLVLEDLTADTAEEVVRKSVPKFDARQAVPKEVVDDALLGLKEKLVGVLRDFEALYRDNMQ